MKVSKTEGLLSLGKCEPLANWRRKCLRKCWQAGRIWLYYRQYCLLANIQCRQGGKVVNTESRQSYLPSEIASILCRQSCLPTNNFGGICAISSRGVKCSNKT